MQMLLRSEYGLIASREEIWEIYVDCWGKMQQRRRSIELSSSYLDAVMSEPYEPGALVHPLQGTQVSVSITR